MKLNLLLTSIILTGLLFTTTVNAFVSLNHNQAGKQTATWFDMRWNNLIRQKQSTGCAAAVLASLYTYDFDSQLSEAEVLQWVRYQRVKYQTGIPANRGLDIFEISAYFISHGYIPESATIDVNYLANIIPPVILRISRWDRFHYVILRDINKETQQAMISDPASGNYHLPLSKLQAEWTGNAISFTKMNLALDQPQASSNQHSTNPTK